MGNSQQGAASVSGDKPSCHVGDIVRALHPGLQCFCRARVTEVRKYKLPGAPSRWIVRVRWAEFWTEEPDSTCVVEPTIMSTATVPQNKHLSFIQIVSNPFPYFPQYSEVYFQPEYAALQGDINNWQAGFVVEENEHQYRVEYVNEHYKPHPLLLMAEGEDEEDIDKRNRKERIERERIKADYKSSLIREKLKKDAKKREKIRKTKQLGVDLARQELHQALIRQTAQRAAEKAERIAAGDTDQDEGQPPEEDGPEVEKARQNLQNAITVLHEPMEEEFEPNPDEDNSDEENSEKRVSVSAPSISKQPDTSLIYHIDYQNLDPTFIYDPDLARLDEGAEDEEQEMTEEQRLEMEMGRVDPKKLQHPSQWLNEHGEEKFAAPERAASVRVKKGKSKANVNEQKFASEDGVDADGNFFDPAHEAGGADSDDDDEEEGEADEDGGKARPPPLLTESGESYIDGAKNDPLLRSLEDQQAIDEWEVSHPKFVSEWVNKYSSRLKRQTHFFNALYAKYLAGQYEETMEDKFFKVQREMELLMEKERAKPKKWYQLKRDVDKETEKKLAKEEAAYLKAEEEKHNAKVDAFEDEDTGLEMARREMYEKIVERGIKWVVEDNLELDGDHLDEGSAHGGSTSVRHKRKICDRDQDDIWGSFMSDAWVRYRYEYKDPDHPDFGKTMDDSSSSSTRPRGDSLIGGDKGVLKKSPKKFKWIWAQIQGKDSQEMVLFLNIPDNLRKHQWLQQHGGKGKRREGAASVKLPTNMLLGGGAGGGQDKVVLRKDDEEKNAKLIKFYHDRMRRWAMDSYRRYQIELAMHGMFLVFVNRTAIEATEDAQETEREMNAIITQIHLQHEAATAVKNAQLAQAMANVAQADPEHHSQMESQPQSRLARFNKRGSVIGRVSIFSQMNTSGDPNSPAMIEFIDTSLIKPEFSSNLLDSNAGYGILGYDDMREDGNSLYRAVSLQLFGTPENYMFVKHQCIRHISAHPSYFSQFLDINFEYYLALKFRSMDAASEVTAYGDHLDLQAICEMYDVAVHIYSQVEFGAQGMAQGNTVPSFMQKSSGNQPKEGLLGHQPFIRFYDDVLPDNQKLPTIVLSYAGFGHYDALKRRAVQWPLQTSLGFPVYTRTRIANVVLRARQKTEFDFVERVRVEEARKAYELIATATANAPMGQTRAAKQEQATRRQAKLKRAQEAAAAKAAGIETEDVSDESEEEDVTLETVIKQMNTRNIRQVKPIDTQRMELQRTILQPRELVLCTYIGEVLFPGDVNIQAAIFLDALASCKIEYGTKKELLAEGYSVLQGCSERFWHDMQMQSMAELVSKQNLEGLAAVAMYGQEDGAGGATTMTGEGLKLNLPRVVVMYPYYPADAHLTGEALEKYRQKKKHKLNKSGLPPLMYIEGVQLAVEETVRLVKRLAKLCKLVKTRQATWLPPC